MCLCVAHSAAHNAVENRQHSTPVVLEVHIPKDAWATFQRDTAHGAPGAAFSTHSIKPEWITAAYDSSPFPFAPGGTRADKTTAEMRRRAWAAEDGKTLWLVLLIDGKEEPAKFAFDESEARDEKGRWTNALGAETDEQHRAAVAFHKAEAERLKGPLSEGRRGHIKRLDSVERQSHLEAAGAHQWALAQKGMARAIASHAAQKASTAVARVMKREGFAFEEDAHPRDEAGRWTNASTGEEHVIPSEHDPTGTLSPEAHGWLQHYQWGELGVNAHLIRNPVPSEKVMRELSAYVNKGPVMLYRAEYTDVPPAPGKQVESWSRYSNDADHIVEGNERPMRVVSQVFPASRVIVDTTRLPAAYRKGGANEQGQNEVVVAHGALAARLASIRGRKFGVEDEPRNEKGEWTSGGGGAADADHETLRLYTQSGGTYREVNAGLRDEKDMAAHPTVVALEKAFTERGEPAPPVVYRGIAGYEPEELNLVEGATFTDRGFVSTAASRGDAMKFATGGQPKLSGEQVGIIFKINTGKAPALDMSRYSRYGESEHLLHRGTTFRVTHVEEGYPGEKLAVVTMSVVKK